MNINLINKILRGKRRKEILFSLERYPKTPGLLAKELKVSISNMPKFIFELLELGLISCENPDDYHYKLYRLTKKGKEILMKLKN